MCSSDLAYRKSRPLLNRTDRPFLWSCHNEGDLKLTVASTATKVIMIEAGANEFPDYLPMFLEFLSGLGYSEAQALLDSAARHIAPIDIALQKSESPWRAVTGAILSLSAMKNSEIKLERDDLLPTTEAESFDSPVRFGGNADPVQTVHFKQ